MMVKRAVFFMFIAAFFAACTTANKLVKQGDEKAQNQQYDAASTYYYNALLRKPEHIGAKTGLSISAQKVLDEKFVNFNKLVVENNIDEAMKAYKNAENYKNTAKSVGVPLRWPTEYDEVYADIRAEYVSKLYDEALLQMKDKRYEMAEQIFERIANLDTSYRGITVLRLNTVLEPLYQNGLRQLELGRYKQAYALFAKIVQQDDTYKDAKLLMEEANQKATTTIGVLPIYYSDTNTVVQQIAFARFINDRLMQKTFAYVKVQPYDGIQRTLESRGWTSIADIDKAIEAGRTLGLKYVLWVDVKKVAFNEVPLTKAQKDAYEAFSENILNPYTGTYSAITKFRKVTYDDIYEEHSLNMIVTYKLIATADGKVVLGNQLEQNQKDDVHQFVYTGNINNVYEELPTGNYLPPPNQNWRDLFTNVKRQPLTKEQLANECVHQLAKQISQSVIGFYK
jgi:tetratricopeptide (TPR) repeat protein